MVARRKAGWRNGWGRGPRALLPLAGPPLRVPLRAPPPGLPCLGPPPLCPPPPLGCALSLVSARPCPAFPAEGGSRLGGARVLPRLRPRRRSSPGRLGASRDVRRSGGPPWRLPGSGLPVPRGGPQSLGSRGVPAVRRLPPPALDGSAPVRRTSVPTLPSHSVSLPPHRPPPPRPRARVRLLSFLRLRSTSRAPCPLVPRFPPQPPRPLWREGPGSRVRGGTGRG